MRRFSLLVASLSIIVTLTTVGSVSIGFRDKISNRFGSFFRSLKNVFGSNKKVESSFKSDDELKAGIADFYDKSSGIWLDVWGDDMHHGYYPTPTFNDHKAAQLLMIENSLRWAYGIEKGGIFNASARIESPFQFVDVGCGVGGSSRYIARKVRSELGDVATIKGQGISLSPVQIQRAKEFTAAANLSDSLQFDVLDAMTMHTTLLPKSPEAAPSSGIYNLTWSMESGEHMPDKQAFVGELVRVTAPGGRIIVVTWCHRELKPEEASLSLKEQRLLKRINDAYFLPDWCAGSRYEELLRAQGLQDVRKADWSQFVAPFWPAVLRSALRPRNLLRMLTAGSSTILKGAIAGLWMLRGFQKGLVKFVIITAVKPQL